MVQVRRLEQAFAAGSDLAGFGSHADYGRAVFT
jgi:hypothetical protein